MSTFCNSLVRNFSLSSKLSLSFFLFSFVSSSFITEGDTSVPCASFTHPKNGSTFHLEFIIPNDIFTKDKEPTMSFDVKYEIDKVMCFEIFQEISIVILNTTTNPNFDDPVIIPIDLEASASLNVETSKVGKLKFTLVGIDFSDNMHSIDSIEVEIFKKIKFAGKQTHNLVSTDGSGTIVTVNFGRGTYPNQLSNLLQVFHFDDYNWEVNIGAFCSIAQKFTIMLAKTTLGPGHNYNLMTTYPLSGLVEKGISSVFQANNTHLHQNKTLVIGNDVWIGMGVKVINDIIIGDGAVIGAFSVVRDNIPPYAIAVGNPAKVVKYRYEEKYIRKVHDLKWWDWTDDELINKRYILEKFPEKYFN